MPVIPVLVLSAALSAPASQPANPHAAAEAAAADPPATGLLVTAVIQRRQGDEKGVRPGEVITRYGQTPTPTIDAIVAAIGGAADADGPVAVALVSAEGEREVAFDPGPLGLVVHEVEQGVADELRPASTGAALDLSPLDDGPVEAWYRVEQGVGSTMHAPGEHIGYQHWRVRRADDAVVVEAEVAYDGDLGDKHFLLRAVFDGDPLTTREVRCAWPDHGRVYRLVGVRPGEMRFTLTGVDPGEDAAVEVPAVTAEPLAILMLGGLMPHEPGASLHFTPLDIEQGSPLGPTALHVVGPWFVWRGDAMVKTTRVDVTGSGTTEQSAFVDATGRLLLLDHGKGQVCRLATRAEALDGLPDAMAPVGFDAEVGDGGGAEAAALAPPATGLLVTQVLPGSAAADAGLRPGDVITGYAGRAVSGIDGLVQAVRAGDDGAGRVVLTYVNASGQRAAEVAAGRLGVGGIDVVKGEPRPLRPPATGVAFDFADLDHRPREAWFAFAIDGGHVGFEHHRLRRVGDALLLRSEVAFRHEQWGRQHFIVQTEALADGEATLTRSRYASAPNGFRCDLRVERSGEGTAMVVVDQLMGDERETSRVPVSGAQSDYLATQLAAWMPREAGACWHYEMINLADGSPLGKSSLFVNGRETIEVDGEPVEAWRVEQHTMGKPGRVSWVDGDGRAFRHDYGGGATATRTTRAAALAGLPNDIRPIDAAPTGPTIGRDE